MIRLTNSEWKPTPYVFGTMEPTGIAIHESTSGLQKYSSVNYLLTSKRNREKRRRYGYHVVVERDGTCVQMADLKARLRHAGRSSWKGRKWCNSFMIGVAYVGPGPLTGTLDKAKDMYGYVHTEGVVTGESPYHDKGKLWLLPTREQRATLARVVSEIKQIFPHIKDDDVAGHYQISPGRKIDPPPPNVIDVSAIELGGMENVGESLDAAIGCSPEALVGREVSHVSDTRIVVPTTDQVLRKESREYKTAGVIKGAAATPIVGAGIMEAASLSNVQGVKAYLDIIKSTIAEHSITMLIVGCVVAMIAASLIQHWKRQSYDDGRYEPSGEAET